MGLIDTKFNVDYALDGLREYFVTNVTTDAYGEITDGKWKLSDLKAIGILLLEAVKVVEKLAADMQVVQAGGIKREAVVTFLDECVDFGGLTGWIVEKVDGYIFGMAVDAIVTLLNTKIGKTWLGGSLRV
jgi:hypothetical protein